MSFSSGSGALPLRSSPKCPQRYKLFGDIAKYSDKIYREFGPVPAHQGLNLVEQICPVQGSEAAPEVLGMLPQHLDAIKFWTLGRQIVQIQSLLGPAAPLVVHRIAFVNCSIVEQDDARHRVRLQRYLIKKGDHILACCWPLLSSPYQLAVVAQCTKHVDPLPVR